MRYPSTVVRYVALLALLSAAALGAACGADEKSEPPKTLPDAGEAAEAGPSLDVIPKPSGAPLEGKVNEWTWIDFPDAVCADGSPTGIGVNLGTSNRLLIFLDGGGACWDELTCIDFPTFATDHFDRSTFFAYMEKYFTGSPIDRVNEANPFKNDNVAFLPYCTADIHAGNRITTYRDKTFHHYGRRNMLAYLNRLVPTFANIERVVVIGASAGGLGSLASYYRIRESFELYVGGPKRIDLIDDSGPPFPTKDNVFIEIQNQSWDLVGASPPGCDECPKEGVAVLPYYAQRYPDARFAFVSHDRDEVMSAFFLMTGDAFQSRIQTLVTSHFSANPSIQAFVLRGDEHPALQDLLTAESGTPPVTLRGWIDEMLSGSPSWKTVTP